MSQKSTAKKVMLSLGAFLLIVLFWGIFSYNSLIGLGEDVSTKRSNIETQLQRRADLIPNLVSTVKGYASHESSIINEISESRAKLSGAGSLQEKANADSQLTDALSRLLVVVENYPELKADSQFNQLMDELSGTENRITVSRKDYNESVKNYNQKIKRFPTVIIANMFGFSQSEYFEAAETSRQVPTVDFS